jgi:hypothetical protein
MPRAASDTVVGAEGVEPMTESTPLDPPATTPSRDEGDMSGHTGVPAADAARDRLTAIDDAPLDEHVGIYEDVHRRLQEGLADLDER